MTDWFNLNRYYDTECDSDMKHKYNNDVFMAKMWAAKEIATDIEREYPLNHYYDGAFYFDDEKFINALAQILKKEWFR